MPELDYFKLNIKVVTGYTCYVGIVHTSVFSVGLAFQSLFEDTQ